MQTLLSIYGDMLYRMCLVMLRNTHDAEDAVQETLMKYLEKSPKFANEEHRKAWLLRVANNTCKDILRFNSRRNYANIDELQIWESEYEHELRKAVSSIKISEIQKEKIMRNVDNEIQPRRTRAVFKSASIAAMIAIVLTAGTVFAQVTGIWDNIFNSSDSGINESLEYSYTQNINMDYVMSNGTGFKVESIILDDETFAVVYNLKLDHTAPSFDWVNLADLVVKDENGVVLYGEGKGMISTGGNFSVASEDNITIKVAHINSNENHNYPKSKKLYFSMSSVNLINSHAKTKIVEHLTGDWKFEIDMAEQFVERKAIQYTPTLNDRLKIHYAELTSTGLNIEVEFANEKFSITKRMALIVGDTIYENERQIAVEDGKKIIRTSFPITIYNAPDKLTFIYDGTSIDLIKK